jgi:hypothetical protein
VLDYVDRNQRKRGLASASLKSGSMAASGIFPTCCRGRYMSAIGRIVLQNSKVAAVKIFGENLKRKEVDDSHSFSRATEVAHEFGARR